MGRLFVSLCLVVSIAGASVVHADPMSPGADLTARMPDPAVAPANHKLRRSIGLGLVIGAAALAILGFGFMGGAAKANSDIFAGHAYHPHKEDRRDNFEIADALTFSAAALAFVPGMVLIWDR